MAIEEFQGEYRFLSNFWPVPHGVVLEGSKVRFPTVEHAYVAAKSKDLDVWHKVARLNTPGDAKRFGRTILPRPDWDHVKLRIMASLVAQKFAQEPLLSQLLATGDEELIEGNRWNDTFWGVCNGAGENNLGKIIMRIRAEKSRTNEA